MAHKGYRFGIEWIALNDEPAEVDASEVASLISVCLLADLFGKTTEEVAKAVVRIRIRRRMEGERFADVHE
jgi:hypothetical protein